MAENPYMLTPEEQLLYAAQDPAHPFIDSRVVSTPIEFALNPQKYGYRNLAEAGVDVLSRAGEQAAPYILYNMSPGGVPVTASRNIASDWQNPYMSGTDKSLNTLTNLLNVAMMAAPSQMGQAGASALNAVGQKVGAYADELAPIMKNVAGSEVGGIGKWKPPKALDTLSIEAQKYPTFDEFKKAFLIDLKHGNYYHVTDNPNFSISPNLGPRDMSSMASGKMSPGKLMMTSDLEHWADYYGSDRGYVAVLDMSKVEPSKYRQINRGFGNEFFIDDPSNVRVEKVVTIKQALKEDAKARKALERTISSDEDLRKFYDYSTATSSGKTE